MTDLVVLVPSRERPESARNLVQAFNNTCSANTALVFVVDADDPTLASYQEIIALTTLKVPVSVGVNDNPSSMVPALNQAAVYFSSTVDDRPFALGFMGDDHEPRTYGWDSAYLDELHKLGSGIVYGNDTLQGQLLPTQCAMTTDIVAALGYMAPPNLRHLFVDNFWLDLGTGADCLSYLPEVVIEHKHPVGGKTEWDEGYERVNSGATFKQDEAAYRLYWKVQFENDIAKVRALLPQPQHEWRLFDEGTVPEYTCPQWYATREHAPHLEQKEHRARLMASATLVAQAAFQSGLSTVVDLGSGDGGLLSLLGPTLTGWGYDLQPENLAAAKERGVDVRYGDVVSDDIEWGQIAVCTEMLEHLVDPHAFVRKVFEHVQVLVCSSPRLENASSHYEFHTWAWDEQGYRNLLEQAGFVVKRQQRVFGFQVLLAMRP